MGPALRGRAAHESGGVTEMNEEADDGRADKGRNEQVGYRRPPTATRFQPGRSGNAKGRPRGSRNLLTLFDEELRQPITLVENGRRKRMSKAQAMAMKTVHDALGGDAKARSMVFEQQMRAEGKTGEGASFAFAR